MRPLTEEESKTLFTKLANYLGKNLLQLLSSDAEPYIFRLHRDRVYYVSEATMKLATSVARPNLVSLGTCLGKFSKNGKFRLHISSLDLLAKYAKYKVSVLCMVSNRKLNGVESGRGSPDSLIRYMGYGIWETDICMVLSGVDQAQWRDAIFVREPRAQSAPRSHNRGYSRTPGSGCVQYVGYSAWFWCHCAEYRGFTED